MTVQPQPTAQPQQPNGSAGSTSHPGSRPKGAEPVSYIEPHERDEALAFVANEMARLTGTTYLPRMAGAFIAVAIYTPPREIEITREDGTKTSLLRAPQYEKDHIHQSVVGLVVSMGPDCYKSDNLRKFRSRWCEVGDWVMLPRYEGFHFTYRTVPMQAIYDDKIVAVVPDPAWVQNGYNQPRI